MSRIFITGSSDGLGLMAAQVLVEQGHSVVLHARNIERAEATCRRLPGVEATVTGRLKDQITSDSIQLSVKEPGAGLSPSARVTR